jgi:UPF0042 nucleotide-binding protein
LLTPAYSIYSIYSIYSTMRFIVLTGTSGAGKDTALNYFEDVGYFTIDNLPPRLLPDLAFSSAKDGHERTVAVVDARAGAAVKQLPVALELLKEQGTPVELLFLDASDETLIRRFKETRRPHPIFRKGRGTVLDAIHSERELLSDILALSDKVIDTTNLSPPDLRKELADMAKDGVGPGLTITVESFGFKHGLPIDADLVFDVRFLTNPHYVPELKPLIGTSKEVATYIHQDPLTEPYLEKLFDFIAFSLPQYRREGKAYLTIAIGCTGGRHRSVTIGEDLAEYLRRDGYRVAVYHRDAEREPVPAKDQA